MLRTHCGVDFCCLQTESTHVAGRDRATKCAYPRSKSTAFFSLSPCHQAYSMCDTGNKMKKSCFAYLPGFVQRFPSCGFSKRSRKSFEVWVKTVDCHYAEIHQDYTFAGNKVPKTMGERFLCFVTNRSSLVGGNTSVSASSHYGTWQLLPLWLCQAFFTFRSS